MTLLPVPGRNRRGVAACALAALLLVALPAGASAAYPGENGKIAFERTGDVWVTDADGTNPTNLTGASFTGARPEFSPDGSRIAFTETAGANNDLWVMGADGSNPHELAVPGNGPPNGPTWSPDGSRIAVSVVHFPVDGDPYGTVALKVFDSNTGALVNTLVPTDPGPTAAAQYQSPAWSPTNPNVIAVSYVWTDAVDTQWDIATVNATTGALTMLTSTGAATPNTQKNNSEWTPDGSKIAFSVTGSGIFTIPSSGGTPTPLPVGGLPTYSPDGASLLFFASGGYSKADADGANPQPLIPAPVSGLPSWQPQPGGLKVNTNADGGDTNTTDDRCDADAAEAGEQCTLRAAIQEANARDGADEISFDIDPGGRQTIAPDTVLPQIKDEVTIDGSTQPGAPAGEPGILLDGSGVPAKRAIGGALGKIGLALAKESQGSVIKALGIGNFNVGALIQGNDVTMQGAWMGVFDSLGAEPAPNVTGLQILGATRARIGGQVGALGNVISGNSGIGVLLRGKKAKQNEVVGNIVGPAPNGELPETFASNEEAGVALADGATDNTIGGETQADGNAIGGNGVGVLVDDAGAGNEILSNEIGPLLFAEDDDVFDAGWDVGIRTLDTNLLKKEDEQLVSLNTIAGNGGAGVEVTNSTGVQVSGNGIGTRYGQDCVPPLPNGSASAAGQAHQILMNVAGKLRKGPGVARQGKLPIGKLARTIIGGAGPLYSLLGGNTICGGVADEALKLIAKKGVRVDVTENHVEGGRGLGLFGAIGATVQRNTITGSLGSGILVGDKALADLSRNLITQALDRAITLQKGLGTNEPDPGDADDGPNGLQNDPFLSVAKESGGTEIKVQTSLLSKPRGHYRLEFFGAPTCGPGNSAGAYEFLGEREVRTDGFGIYQELGTVPAGSEHFGYVVATVTHLDGNTPVTSQLSKCREVVPASQPAVGIAPTSLQVKKGKVSAVVDCLDTTPCTGEARILDRVTAEEYGSVEVSEPFTDSQDVKIPLNDAGKDELDEFGKMLAEFEVEMTTSAGSVAARIDALIRAGK